MNVVDIDEITLNVDIPAELYRELETESERLGLPVQSTLNRIICDRYVNMSIDELDSQTDVDTRYSEDMYHAKVSDRGLWVVLISGIILIGSLTIASLSL